jgi:hypothetical protein
MTKEQLDQLIADIVSASYPFADEQQEQAVRQALKQAYMMGTNKC